MIQNTIVFIINSDGSYYKQPPNTKFTANSVNKNSIFVIAPFVKTASIIANFKVAHKAQQESRVAELTNMQPREITNESYVFDWNVWEVKVPQPTLNFLANNRGSEILVSFTVGETTPSRVPTNFETILGEITDKEFILPSITVDGRYIVKIASYEYDSGKYAFFNDTIIADNTAQEYKIFRAKYSAGTTPTVAFKIDPSIPMENFDEYEPTVVEQLIIQANENSGDIVDLENEVIRVEQKIDTHIVDADNPHGVTAEQVGTYDKATINNKLDGKVDKVTTNSTYKQVYAKNPDGSQTMIDAAEDGVDKIVIRRSDGNIWVPLVTSYPSGAVSKYYVDNINFKVNDLRKANMFKDVSYNNVNGVLTFTRYDGTVKDIDLPLELIVTSGYYDEVTNELVLVLANGSEIRIPVDNLLTDLDAHNIRFNGSGTNYLNDKTEVEGAIKELDTRVKGANDDIALRVKTSDIVNDLTSTDVDKPLSANQGKVLNDTTAKLAASNVFTQPQQVPNATLPQHATNLIQVETMFEMFKQQLRGYNLAKPDLSTATDLGGGNYRLYNNGGITMDYNANDGVYTLNGTIDTGQNILIPIGYVSGWVQGDTYTSTINVISTNAFSGDSRFESLRINTGGSYGPYWANHFAEVLNGGIMSFTYSNQNNNTFNLRLWKLTSHSSATFNNLQFTLQIEKGSTATPYTVPGQIPQYKIVGEE